VAAIIRQGGLASVAIQKVGELSEIYPTGIMADGKSRCIPPKGATHWWIPPKGKDAAVGPGGKKQVAKEAFRVVANVHVEAFIKARQRLNSKRNETNRGQLTAKYKHADGLAMLLTDIGVATDASAAALAIVEASDFVERAGPDAAWTMTARATASVEDGEHWGARRALGRPVGISGRWVPHKRLWALLQKAKRPSKISRASQRDLSREAKLNDPKRLERQKRKEEQAARAVERAIKREARKQEEARRAIGRKAREEKKAIQAEKNWQKLAKREVKLARGNAPLVKGPDFKEALKNFKNSLDLLQYPTVRRRPPPELTLAHLQLVQPQQTMSSYSLDRFENCVIEQLEGDKSKRKRKCAFAPQVRAAYPHPRPQTRSGDARRDWWGAQGCHRVFASLEQAMRHSRTGCAQYSTLYGESQGVRAPPPPLPNTHTQHTHTPATHPRAHLGSCMQEHVDAISLSLSRTLESLADETGRQQPTWGRKKGSGLRQSTEAKNPKKRKVSMTAPGLSAPAETTTSRAVGNLYLEAVPGDQPHLTPAAVCRSGLVARGDGACEENAAGICCSQGGQ
jgi:hypothetical protein